MLLAEAVDEIQVGLKFRNDQDDNIKKRLTRAQELLQQGLTLPWFLIVENQPLLVTTGDSTVGLPTNFIRELSEGRGLNWLTSEGKRVWPRKMSRDEALGVFQGSSSGYAKAYVLKKSEFELFPAPGQNYTLYLDYYKKALPITNPLNEWLVNAPYLLIGTAGASMARTLGIKDAQEEFEVMVDSAWKGLFKEIIQREISNRRYLFGRNS